MPQGPNVHVQQHLRVHIPCSFCNQLASVSCKIAHATFTTLCRSDCAKVLWICIVLFQTVASYWRMASQGLGQAPGQPAEVQLVSLLACFEELLMECLGARSTFIRGQYECLSGNGVLKVPAEAARAWIRGMLSTPDQLRALSTNSLVRYVKASEFFQDSHLVKVLCSVLGERLLSTDALATNHSTEQPSAKRPRLHPAHVLDQVPTDLAIEVLRCAPGTISSQLRQLPQSLSSLVALAAFPALAAACTLPSDCPGAASDLPTLTLCVDVGQAGDADAPALASAVTTSHNAGLICGSTVAQGSIWVYYDDHPDIPDDDSLFSLEQRPHVVACPLLARSDSVMDLSLQLPACTCLVVESGSAVLDIRRAKFEGGAVVCMGSTCSATFRDVVFDKCSLVVMGGAQATLHNTHFKNMEHSEARLGVYAHGSGSQVHLQGGAIAGGVQGVAVQAAARLQASDLTVTGLQLLGLEVCGAESMLTVQRGTIDSFLSLDEIDERFLQYQQGVCVHSHASAQLSGVAIGGMLVGCAVAYSASAALADCTVSDTQGHCVAVSHDGTAQLDKCTLTSGEEDECVLVRDEGSHVTATSCRLHGEAFVSGGGRLTAHACDSSGHNIGYNIWRGVMELLNCSIDGCVLGCSIEQGHLTATNVTVTNSLSDGFQIVGGITELRGCSVTGSQCACGMRFDGPQQGGVTEARVEDCTVTQNRNGGLHAMGSASVAVRGCLCRDNGGAAFRVGGEAQMAVAHSSSDGDAAGCVADDGGGGGVLTMEEVTVDGAVQSGTLRVTS